MTKIRGVNYAVFRLGGHILFQYSVLLLCWLLRCSRQCTTVDIQGVTQTIKIIYIILHAYNYVVVTQ